MLDWRQLLTLWSTQLMASELADRVDPPPPDPAWLGFDPAPEAAIRALEDRLGLTLPPSYRAFLAVSDGWQRTTFAIGRVRSAAEVDWFRVENEHWVECYSEVDSNDPDDSQPPDEELYTYPDEGNGPYFRRGHLRWLLQISDREDGVYLLNPEAVTPDGEWEAWFFANWIPGADRYPSFAHLMLAEYRSFAKLEEQPVPDDLPTLPTPDPLAPRTRALRRHDPDITPPSLDILIEQMQTQQGKPLDRAITIFFGRMGTKAIEGQRPDLEPTLTDLFRSSSNPRIRIACLKGIRHLSGEVRPPDLFFEALSDPDPGVVFHATWPVNMRSPERRALELICRSIEAPAPPAHLGTKLTTLMLMGDERAVPSLSRVLLNTNSRSNENFESAGMALGYCGDAGLAALEEAVDHPDPRVRLGVAIGLSHSRHQRASEILARLEEDPDPRVAEQAHGERPKARRKRSSRPKKRRGQS